MKLSRRDWLVAGGVGAAAAAAGAGWSMWRQRGERSSTVEGELWTASFDTPTGTRLSLAELRGHPLVLNFWATWCPPCLREMPTLDRFARDFAARGWRVVGLAADNAQPVREFLDRAPVSYAIGLTGFAGIELSRQLGNESGGLPFTLLFDRNGALRQRRMGETSYKQLADWAQGIS
jgi:thiol-disulfide isomerase/thioredoxin